MAQHQDQCVSIAYGVSHQEDSVGTYQDYLTASRLPDCYGISARVVNCLLERVGSGSLSATNVAVELNVSKRTLQRRLQQQGLSFTELRDRVRLNYVLPLLVANEVSIDRLSAMLDFSDRTSFTLAFKRWTGLSPNAFRKLFRDYI